MFQRILKKSAQKELIGIRYFSCTSRETAEMGFNYVFPASGERDATLNNHYCSVLAKAFELTQPIIIEREKVLFLQNSMDSDRGLGKVDD